jgi:protein-disulfide isomerase
MNKKLIVVLTAAVAVLAFFLGAFIHTAQKNQKIAGASLNNREALVRPHSPVLGSATAKVTIVEFLDPSCETCRAFYPIVKALVSSSFGQVKLVVRYAAFHKGSDEAIKILESARMQNLYWPVLDVVIKSQPVWASHDNPQSGLIWDLIKDTGIDINKAKTNASDPAIAKLLEQDMADARALKVTKTPGFFVNGKPLTDFGSDQLKALVASEIRAAYGQ